MKFNKKLIYSLLTLLLLCWIGNIIYYKNHIIDKPIFLKHYYSVKSNNFLLYYLNDINSQNRVTNLEFPELGTESIPFSEFDLNTDNRYYSLKTLSVTPFYYINDTVPNRYKNKVITKANITFSNGNTQTIKIGQIKLLDNNLNTSSLNQGGVSCSNDNSGDFSFTTDKDIYITGIDTKSYDPVKDVIEISIDGKPLSKVKFPIMLRAKYQIDISYNFNFSKNPSVKNNVYLFNLELLTKDLNGNNGITPCYIQMQPNMPDDLNIDVLKNEKGRD